MAQVIQDDDQRVVCRVEPIKIWAGIFAIAIGVAFAVGLIHERGDTLDLFDRVVNVGIGLFMVVVGLVAAGPEDLILDFPSRTYRLRAGPRFLAMWEEGNFASFDHLELIKHRGSTRWSVRLRWQGRRKQRFDLATFDDTGAERTDPRLHARRVMEGYAARLGIPSRDETGDPIGVQPSFAPSGNTFGTPPSTPGVAAPPPPRIVPRTPVVEVKTQHFRLFTAGSTLHLEKARWFILADDWQMVFWSILAGPILGYILWLNGVYPSMLRQSLGAIGRMMGAALQPGGGKLSERGEDVLILVVTAFVTPFALAALYAWKKLLHSVWRVVRGEDFTLEWDRQRLAFNGHELSSLSGVHSVEVREHIQPDTDSGYDTWYNLSVIFQDTRRVTLISGDREELSKLAAAIASFLGVEAACT
jgi:hypothetical protein